MTDAGFFDPRKLVSHVSITPEMRIADFGCGSGEIAVIMAGLVGKDGVVTAIDVLPSALESVEAKAKSANLANIVPVRANLESPRGSKLDDQSQDIVFMANVLWQSKKKGDIIGEAARILKKDGALIAVEWEKKENKIGPPPELRVDAQELRQLCAAAGLEYIESFPAGGFHYGLIAKKI